MLKSLCSTYVEDAGGGEGAGRKELGATREARCLQQARLRSPEGCDLTYPRAAPSGRPRQR